MKPKVKTLLEKQGFLDADRSTPVHDEIQVWISNNIETFLSKWVHLVEGAENIPLTRENWNINVYLEKPVKATSYKTEYIVGFIDIYIFISSKKRIRYIDITGAGEKYVQAEFAIEIKTKTPSAGELLRQINFYRAYLPANWIVVAPEDHFANILESQGIGFFKFYSHLDVKPNHRHQYSLGI